MKNKVTVLFLGLFVAVIMANFGTQYVQANNCRDEAYYFNYSGDGSDVATQPRGKTDASSAYAMNLSTHCSHFISVAGTQDKDHNPAIAFDNCTYHAYWIEVKVGEYRYLPNLVYESGYKYAYLVISPGSHLPCLVKGKWSPDSV